MVLRDVAHATVRAVRAVCSSIRRPPYVIPGHFYSPSTSEADIARTKMSRRDPIGVALDIDKQKKLVAQLALKVPTVGRWVENEMFNLADAAFLQAVIRHFEPSRIVEVGSGYSTAASLDAADMQEYSDLKLICIEPYPDRLRSRLREGDDSVVTIIESKVQDLQPEVLVAELKKNDIFFIDSTHVAKAGSDVLWLLLYTLPLIPSGVLVHVHDVHWPFEYPDAWLDEKRDWTESYFLHAFLIGNTSWEVLLFADLIIKEFAELVPEFAQMSAGSIWLRKL